MTTKCGRRRRIPFALHLKNVFISFPLILHATQALSLSDWQPSAQGLTPSCESIYTAYLPYCSANDFQNAGCSQACIDTLLGFNDLIFNACGGDPQNDQFLVGEFLVGRGTSDLCPNVAVSTIDNGGVPETTLSINLAPTQTGQTSVIISSNPDAPVSMLQPSSSLPPYPTGLSSRSSTATSSTTSSQKKSKSSSSVSTSMSSSSSSTSSSSKTKSASSSSSSKSSKSSTTSSSSSSSTSSSSTSLSQTSTTQSSSSSSSSASSTSKPSNYGSCKNGNGLLLTEQCTNAPSGAAATIRCSGILLAGLLLLIFAI